MADNKALSQNGPAQAALQVMASDQGAVVHWCVWCDEFQLGPIAVLSACCCTADGLCQHATCAVLTLVSPR